MRMATALEHIVDALVYEAHINIARAIGDEDWADDAIGDAIISLELAGRADFWRHGALQPHPALVTNNGYQFYRESFELTQETGLFKPF